jgi:hypothetical protein
VAVIVVEIVFPGGKPGVYHPAARSQINRQVAIFPQRRQILQAWQFARSARRLYGAENVTVRVL